MQQQPEQQLRHVQESSCRRQYWWERLLGPSTLGQHPGVGWGGGEGEVGVRKLVHNYESWIMVSLQLAAFALFISGSFAPPSPLPP